MDADVIPPMPQAADLRRLVHFSSNDGRIWLAGNRMLLLHVEALGSLRKELMRSVGTEQTKRVFKRAGYAAGSRDAALARRVRPNASAYEQFSVGPQLHMLEGAVQVTPEHFQLDFEAGTHLGIFRWDHSWEVDAHVKLFGPQEDPVCWMLVGYASGYVTAFMGKPVIYKETQCAACGHDHCMIEGRPLTDWPDAAQLQEDYEADSLLIRIEDLAAELESLRTSLSPSDDLGELIGRSKTISAVD